jgi:hypothetical protein
MKLNMSFQVLDEDTALAHKINSVLIKKINEEIKTNLPYIKYDIYFKTAELLKQSDFYMEFTGDTSLAGQLGVPGDRQAKLDEILDVFTDYVYYDFKPFGLNGSTVIPMEITFHLYDSSYHEILDLDSSYLDIVTSDGDMFRIDWLAWSLINGDDARTEGYRFSPGRAGRTGLGFMTKTSKAPWRMPLRYRGTYQNNWIINFLRETLSIYKRLTILSIKEGLKR